MTVARGAAIIAHAEDPTATRSRGPADDAEAAAGVRGVADTGPPPPFIPIVRSLFKYPLGSPEFLDAARCADPEEVSFAREILQQQRERAEDRRDQVLDQLRDLSTSSRSL
ncbi:MAG: hypothetical protein H0T20_02585 [Actinobacteria bacterium]|nr:hypothetical protein [Actinomycetota bacterium]